MCRVSSKRAGSRLREADRLSARQYEVRIRRRLDPHESPQNIDRIARNGFM
jgi:hypothetical protein